MVTKTFECGDFVNIFREIFTYDEIHAIEKLCENTTITNNFILYISPAHEYTIVNKYTRDTVTYYQQFGRYNICQSKGSTFGFTELENFAKELHADVKDLLN